MVKSTKTRRDVIGSAIGTLCFAAMAKPLSAAEATPRATEGPFYPTPAMRGADVDNDLVKVIGAVREAGGEVITLKGRVLNKQGAPLANMRVEIWQCDMNGKYLHTGDRQNVEFDTGFQGFGHDITNEDGQFVFRTIKPVTYPGRTPHIHAKVFEGSKEVLTTQFYIAGHPANGRDRIFSRMSDSAANAVSMVFSPTNNGVETTIDVVI